MTSYYGEYEPPEEWSDYVCVEASNEEEAFIKAVEAFIAKNSEWITYQKDDDASPFEGLRAKSMICTHGRCNCEIDKCINSREFDICPECYTETEQEYAN